jgi:hypothetical protein
VLEEHKHHKLFRHNKQAKEQEKNTCSTDSSASQKQHLLREIQIGSRVPHTPILGKIKKIKILKKTQLFWESKMIMYCT